MHRDKGGKTSSSSSLGNISICFPPRAMILDDFLLRITAACLLFPSYTTQNWGFKKTECIHTEHKSLCQEGNDRAYQKRCVPVMSAIPSMLKYEINEVEFNFRVYKFVMCSSFLLPFCMAGWSWLTCFVRRAALEFWLNQVLSPSPLAVMRKRCHSSLRGRYWRCVSLLLSWGQAFWWIFPSWTANWLPSRGRTAPVPQPQSSSSSPGVDFSPHWAGQGSWRIRSGLLRREEMKTIVREKIKSNHFRFESVTFKMKGLLGYC